MAGEASLMSGDRNQEQPRKEGKIKRNPEGQYFVLKSEMKATHQE